MKKKILIVDDEADMRLCPESLIAEQGYETATASDGDNGYNLAKSFKPDVITLDVSCFYGAGNGNQILSEPVK